MAEEKEKANLLAITIPDFMLDIEKQKIVIGEEGIKGIKSFQTVV